MWNVFSDKREGIAIRSSEARFEKAFSGIKQSVMGGKIEYGDFFDENFVIDDENAFLPVLHKRKDFSYENEYRLVHWDTTIVSKKVKSKNGYFIFEDATIPDRTAAGIMNVSLSVEELENKKIIDAIEIHCDINELIEDIVISPLANDMFFKVVEDISKDKYGLKAPVIKSKLLSESLM